MNFDSDRATLLSLQGSMAYDEGNYINAENKYQNAYELEASTGRILGIVDTLFYVGLMRYKNGDFLEAHKAFDESLRHARENNMPNMQIKNYIGIALTQKTSENNALYCHTLERAERLHTNDITYLPATEALIRELDCPYPPLNLE